MKAERQRIANQREEIVAEKYEAEGWQWLKKGWPDFLFYKPDGQLMMVEVKKKPKRKRSKGGLSANQRAMKAILEKHHHYVVEYVDLPNVTVNSD